MSSKSKIIAGFCGAALAMGIGGGLASAAPVDTEKIANSTCTYPQVIAALTAQDPVIAQKLTSDPVANGYLQRLVASDPNGRRQLIAQVQAFPAAQQYTGLISSVSNTCNDF